MADDKPDSDDYEKPDPNEYKIQMREVRESDALRHDDFVGSYDNTGRLKLEKKRWQPKKAVESTRVDDWVGGAQKPQRTWRVKTASASSGLKSDSQTDEEDARKKAQSAKPSRATSDFGTTRRWKPPPKNEGIPPPWMASPEPERRASTMPKWKPKGLPSKVSQAAAQAQEEEEAVSEGEGSPSPDKAKASDRMWNSHSALDYNNDDDRVDPTSFKQMFKTQNDESNRTEGFVTDFSNTGRIKVSSRKSWQPQPTTESERQEEWMGPPASQSRRSWQVKSSDKKKEKAPAPSAPRAPDLDNSASNFDVNDDDDSSAVEVDSDSEAQENEANEAEGQGRDDSSAVEVDSDDDEPPKEAEAPKQEETKRPGGTTSNVDHEKDTSKEMSRPDQIKWKSTSDIESSSNDVDDDKPDPNEYKIKMREVRESDALRHDDFVGSYDKTGRVKFEKKRWQPKKPVETTRVDDWLGSGKAPPRRSWKVKSTSSVPKIEDPDSEEEAPSPAPKLAAPSPALKPVAAPAPAPEPEPEENEPAATLDEPASDDEPEVEVDSEPEPETIEPSATADELASDDASEYSEYEVDSDEEETPAAATVSDDEEPEESPMEEAAEPAEQEPEQPKEDPEGENDEWRPDPKEFVQMREANEAGGARLDDFVGSYNNTGRVKLDKKTWESSKPVEKQHVDEWLGSGKQPRQASWKAK
jgi:hypothetical protein